MKNIIYVLVLMSLFSCKDNVPQEISSNFEISKIENLTINCNDDIINVSTNLEYLNNKLYWIDTQQESQLFSGEIKDDKYLIISDCMVKKGRGPGEYENIHSLKCLSDRLTFLDINKKKLFSGRDSLFSELVSYSAIEGMILDVIVIDSNTSVISGMFNDSRFQLYDKYKGVVSKFSKFSNSIDDMPFSLSMKNMGSQGIMTTKGNSFANITYDSGVIEFFEIVDGEIVKKREYEFSENSFSLIDINGAQMVKHDDTNTGFIDISSSNNLVMTLYSSVSWADDAELASQGDWLLLFDWSGSPLKAYSLKYPIQRFAYDDRNQIIWGFTVINDTQKLVGYKL